MDDLDIRIRQKVGAAQRQAFGERYPGQVEHCLRLILECLQACLVKRGDQDPAQPESWTLSTQEIADLAQAAHNLDHIRRQWHGPEHHI